MKYARLYILNNKELNQFQKTNIFVIFFNKIE